MLQPQDLFDPTVGLSGHDETLSLHLNSNQEQVLLGDNKEKVFSGRRQTDLDTACELKITPKKSQGVHGSFDGRGDNNSKTDNIDR